MPKTLRATLPSSAIKAAYQKALIVLIDEMRDSVLWWIKARYRAREDEIVMDESPAVELEKEIQALFRQWDRRFDDFAKTKARQFARRVNTAVTSQLWGAMKDAGLTVRFRNSRRVNSALQSIIAGNVGLITSIPQQYHDRVRNTVMQGIQNGRDLGFIAKDIEGHYDKTRARAVMIARDQTNKATEAVSRARCMDLGIEEGVWMHRSGSKVPRPTHVAMDGRRYRIQEGLYDSAYGDNVRPGELINCHCTYRPIIPGLEAA